MEEERVSEEVLGRVSEGGGGVEGGWEGERRREEMMKVEEGKVSEC